MRRGTFRGAVAIMALTTAALIGTAGSALACYTDDNLPNPVPDRGKAACADDKTLDHGDVDFTGGEGKSTLSITAVHDGVKVTRIVVIGGDDGFNEYLPGKIGKGGETFPATAPWKDLKATKTFEGSQPNIDKWLLCGTKIAKPSESPTPTKPTTTTSKPSTPASSTSASPTSTTAPAAVPAGNQAGTGGGLANTGFDNMWLVWVAGALLVVGGGLLALLKFRRRASE